jgi:RimJ/RimL family protein N-acetyltransferase
MSAIVTLRRGVQGDIAFVMATERLEGYGELVGRWEADRHLAALSDGRHAYFIAESQGERAGFAILRDWASAEKATLVKRVAIVRTGQGVGTAMIRALVAEVFEATDAYRLWIGVFPENLRARRAYEAVGFQAEGVARGSAFFHGEHRDELILSILRPEWTGRRSHDL